MSEIRDKLTEIEAKFAEDIDLWYVDAKEYLKGYGPHWLGLKKEHVKSHLFYLGEYVEEVKAGIKSNNKSKLSDYLEIIRFEDLEIYIEELENRNYELESIKAGLIKDSEQKMEERQENE